jgi:hypothetical protein
MAITSPRICARHGPPEIGAASTPCPYETGGGWSPHSQASAPGVRHGRLRFNEEKAGGKPRYRLQREGGDAGAAAYGAED